MHYDFLSGVPALWRGLHLVTLAVWLGGAVFLFAAVAPGAFEVVADPRLAGRVVGVVLSRLDLWALVAAPIWIATGWYDERTRGNPTALWVRVSALVAVGAEAAVSYFGITPRMAALRESPGYPGSAAMPWPHRAEFDMLHGLSVGLLILGVACALVALFLAARRRPLADALQEEQPLTTSGP
jgi:hypothetical protein